MWELDYVYNIIVISRVGRISRSSGQKSFVALGPFVLRTTREKKVIVFTAHLTSITFTMYGVSALSRNLYSSTMFFLFFFEIQRICFDQEWPA